MATRRRRSVDTIKVTVAPTFGEVKQVSVPVDSTVEDVLQAAGYGSDVEVRINGEGSVDNETIVEDGDELSIVSSRGKVEAGNC